MLTHAYIALVTDFLFKDGDGVGLFIAQKVSDTKREDLCYSLLVLSALALQLNTPHTSG